MNAPAAQVNEQFLLLILPEGQNQKQKLLIDLRCRRSYDHYGHLFRKIGMTHAASEKMFDIHLVYLC
ncbi:MAG TPA: hypothetical protein VFB12_14860 [Ktedonobacteraceae bacterium]|nr:hypothetical protein [Ktedonobacteraceae bacterium]